MYIITAIKSKINGTTQGGTGEAGANGAPGENGHRGADGKPGGNGGNGGNGGIGGHVEINGPQLVQAVVQSFGGLGGKGGMGSQGGLGGLGGTGGTGGAAGQGGPGGPGGLGLQQYRVFSVREGYCKCRIYGQSEHSLFTLVFWLLSNEHCRKKIIHLLIWHALSSILFV